MKNFIVLFLLIFTVCLFFTIILLQPFSNLSAAGESGYHYWIIISVYVCVIFTLILNRESLALYSIDKLSLLILVLAGGTRVYLHTPNEVLYKNIVLVLSLILFCIAATNWSKIPNTKMNWVFLGVFSCILVIPLAFVESFQLDKYSLSNTLYKDHFFVYAIRNFLYNLAFVAPIEEILLRSILWGEMRKKQFGEEKIFWIQGLLFWSMHFWKILTPITFFITLPAGILMNSLLAKYSKQISPSIISHLLFNTLTPMLVYLILMR